MEFDHQPLYNSTAELEFEKTSSILCATQLLLATLTIFGLGLAGIIFLEPAIGLLIMMIGCACGGFGFYYAIRRFALAYPTHTSEYFSHPGAYSDPQMVFVALALFLLAITATFLYQLWPTCDPLSEASCVGNKEFRAFLVVMIVTAFLCFAWSFSCLGALIYTKETYNQKAHQPDLEDEPEKVQFEVRSNSICLCQFVILTLAAIVQFVFLGWVLDWHWITFAVGIPFTIIFSAGALRFTAIIFNFKKKIVFTHETAYTFPQVILLATFSFVMVFFLGFLFYYLLPVLVMGLTIVLSLVALYYVRLNYIRQREMKVQANYNSLNPD